MKIDKRLLKSIISFAIPVFFDQGFVALLFTMNTIMCAAAGTAAVSAVGMVDSIHMLVNQFFISLAVGGTVMVAQNIGSGDRLNAKKAAKQAIITGSLLAAAVSLVIFILRAQILNFLFGQVSPDIMDQANDYYFLSILSYPFQFFIYQGFGVLRGAADTRTPMFINLVTTAINLLLGFVLIIGVKMPNDVIIGGMGTFGASLAYFISRVIGSVFVFKVLSSFNSPIRLNFFRKFSFDKDLIKKIYNIGIPASTESLLFTVGRLVTQVFISTMGASIIAVNSIANSISTLYLIPGNAMCVVATTLVGSWIGARDTEGAKKTLIYCVLISIFFIFVLFVPFFVFSDQFVSFYSNDPQIITGAGYLVKTFVAASILWPVAFIMPSGFRGASDALFPLVTAVSVMWLLRIMLGYYLGIVLGYGVIGVWIGMYADWVVKTIIYTLRYVRGGWLKKVKIKQQEE